MDKDTGGVSIQDQYLGKARKDRSWLTVVLNSGKKISGRIISFDRYTVILEDRGGEQMVFKHAIATISTARSFSNAIDFNRARPAAEPSTAAADGESRAGDAPAGTGPSRSRPPGAD